MTIRLPSLWKICDDFTRGAMHACIGGVWRASLSSGYLARAHLKNGVGDMERYPLCINGRLVCCALNGTDEEEVVYVMNLHRFILYCMIFMVSYALGGFVIIRFQRHRS